MSKLSRLRAYAEVVAPDFQHLSSHRDLVALRAEAPRREFDRETFRARRAENAGTAPVSPPAPAAPSRGEPGGAASEAGRPEVI